MKSFSSLCLVAAVCSAVPLGSPPLALGSSASPPPAELPALADAEPDATPPRTPSGAYRGPPPVTRRQILDIARSALGVPYVLGAEAWAQDVAVVPGTDCSGLIAKAWQVPRALEAWEELDARPTTETLSVETSQWSRIPLEERLPGDILVRFEDDVRHAFIYERDASELRGGREIWVYEAANPRVNRRRYRLADLRAYVVLRRHNLDEIGIVGRSHEWIYGDMIDAFGDAGGEAALGVPYDRGQGVLVHAWSSATDSGFVQDFHGGSLGEAAIVLSFSEANVSVLRGDGLRSFRAP